MNFYSAIIVCVAGMVLFPLRKVSTQRLVLGIPLCLLLVAFGVLQSIVFGNSPLALLTLTSATGLERIVAGVYGLLIACILMCLWRLFMPAYFADSDSH